MDEATLSVRDVAKRLGVTERWVRQFIADHELRAAKIRQWRITERDLRDFIDKRMNKASDDMQSQLNRVIQSTPGSLLPGVECVVLFDMKISDARLHAHLVTHLLSEIDSIEWSFRTDDEGRYARHVVSGPEKQVSAAMDRLRSLASEEGNQDSET
jgi:excisionase family DNA binding protein